MHAKHPVPRWSHVEFVDEGVKRVGAVVWIELDYGLYLVECKPGRTYRSVAWDCTVLLKVGGNPALHVGIVHELSFDAGAREGCLRRPGAFWECFFVYLRSQSDEFQGLPRLTSSRWSSGIYGHRLDVSSDWEISRERVSQLLSSLLNVPSFTVVDGPDSMLLK